MKTKTQYLQVRLTEPEKKILLKRAAAMYMSQSQYIRYCLFCLKKGKNSS